MFKWLSQQEAAAPARAAFDLETVRQQPFAIVFKHSRSCPVSWAADAQVTRFREAHPAVPVYKLIVQEDRALSNDIAASTGIRHESPQVLIFRQGQLIAHESHEGVTTEFLAELSAG
jgi:bacillithiol system protein YtxJ